MKNYLKKGIVTIMMAYMLFTIVGVSSNEVMPHWNLEENIEIL